MSACACMCMHIPKIYIEAVIQSIHKGIQLTPGRFLAPRISPDIFAVCAAFGVIVIQIVVCFIADYNYKMVPRYPSCTFIVHINAYLVPIWYIIDFINACIPMLHRITPSMVDDVGVVLDLIIGWLLHIIRQIRVDCCGMMDISWLW